MAYRLAIFMLCLGSVLFCRQSRAEESLPVFETEIQPLLAVKCGKCHSKKVQKGGLDLSSMSGLHVGGESGESLIAESIDDSLLWTQIDDGDMPPEDESQLSDKERMLIRQWIASGARSADPQPLTKQPTNQHDVLPILLLRCTTCHGPRIQDGGLDLRTRAAMLKGGKHGPALIQGDPDASLLIQRIESEACPPRELLLKFFVRRPPSSEIETLRDWIASGAPEADAVPDIGSGQGDPLVTDEDRQHWAFQPLGATPQEQLRSGSSSITLPSGESASQGRRGHSRAALPGRYRVRPSQREGEYADFSAQGTRTRESVIDEFVVKKLHEKGLTFSPEANRDTLIRRAFLDLVGMPPNLSEWQQWRRSDDSNWYATMVDHLLASPHYGQRWGRYWLDLAGYADSEGGISADPLRAVAWKYRDYVIGAFNDDKPYDQFLVEQIAGDELFDYENASVVTQEMVDDLIATGFLRMGIDETGSRTMNFVPERLKVIGDAITVVSSGLMGLTMECARCHSHKYDPIPHRDYYRFKAIFQGALDEHDWSSFKNRVLTVATSKHRESVAAVNPPLQAEIKKLAAAQKKAAVQIQIELLRHHYPDQSEADHQETLVARKKADNNRTLHQKTLVERLLRAELLPDSQQPESVLEIRRRMQEFARTIERVRRQMVPPLEIRALWDFGRPSPTYILRRGEYNKPGALVGPGVPSALTDGRTPLAIEPPFPDGTRKTGRRLAFARWLTRPDNPLTARVMINRIWYHHFGTGLVKELENFGVKGGRPSHPQLLDWLALEFTARGWSIKEMHRLIMNSRTYRQSSRVSDQRLKTDPLNRLLSRMPLRRLDAEAIRDSLLLISGKLDDTPGGIPDTVSVNRDGLVSVNPTDGGGWRRSVYLQYRRTEIPTMMDTFDYPQMGPNCLARNSSTVSPQSLMLMNNGHVRKLAAAFAARVEEIVADAGDVDVDVDVDELDCGACVDTVYGLALSRPPSDEERNLGVETLKELELLWQGNTHQALETYCHTIFNSAAFLYVD